MDKETCQRIQQEYLDLLKSNPIIKFDQDMDFSLVKEAFDPEPVIQSYAVKGKPEEIERMAKFIFEPIIAYGKDHPLFIRAAVINYVDARPADEEFGFVEIPQAFCYAWVRCATFDQTTFHSSPTVPVRMNSRSSADKCGRQQSMFTP